MYCQNNKHLKSIADDSVDESVESNESVYKVTESGSTNATNTISTNFMSTVLINLDNKKET